MLTEQEAVELSNTIHATAEILGQDMRPAVVSVLLDDLDEYPFLEIKQALRRCRAELSGKLTLAAILERMPSAHAFDPPLKAWSDALEAHDESATVVWTQEQASAFAAARPLIEAEGPGYAARATFCEVYKREVERAKTEGRKPQALISPGHDPAQREQVIREAVESGKLESEQAAPVLPAPQTGPRTEQERANFHKMIGMVREALHGNRENAKRERQEAEEDRRQQLLEQAQRLEAQNDDDQPRSRYAP